jgi:hypothetical protein
MVEKWVFITVENKTRTIHLSMVWHLCVLVHFHPIQPHVRSRINKNKLALFSWIFSTCIGEHVLVLSKHIKWLIWVIIFFNFKITFQLDRRLKQIEWARTKNWLENWCT